uniref:ODAD1 central coiled coil region domain-containing protein n=1 Tax=Timema poppense TaxID=170557 RepID=A0A7R9CNH0_TIMPO|nr:unnamed protein product [Timema poppensis]
MNYEQQRIYNLELHTAKKELQDLQRHYFNLRISDKYKMDMAQMYLKRQRKMIGFLKSENEDLLANARVAGSKGKEATAAEIKAVIKDRLSHMEQYKNKIKIERTQLKELQTQIIKLEKELNRVKVKDKMSEHAILARAVEYEHLLNRLKCRLEVGHDKFGVMLSENKSLRDEITFLLQERHNFNAVYSSLVTLYTKGNTFISSLNEQAILTFCRREEACKQLKKLKCNELEETKMASNEINDLIREEDDYIKFHKFIAFKNSLRVLSNLEERIRLKREKQFAEEINMVERYTVLINKIIHLTGEKDLKQLVRDFQKKEESNFSLYTNVIILNEEVQKIEHSIQCLNNDNGNLLAGDTTRETMSQRKNVLLEESRSATNKANEKKAWCEQKMETLMKGLETIFALLGGDRDQMLKKLGDNTHVSLSNVEMHLIAIEFRINELLNVLSYLEDRESLAGLELYRLYYPLEDENSQIYNRLEQWKEEIKQMAVTTPCALCVEQQELTKEGKKCDGRLQLPLVKEELKLDLKERANRLETILHNVSVCLLPKSRQIVEKRMN